MATADEYAAWIVKNADKRGTPEFDTIAAAYKDARSRTGGEGMPSGREAQSEPSTAPSIASTIKTTAGAALPYATAATAGAALGALGGPAAPVTVPAGAMAGMGALALTDLASGLYNVAATPFGAKPIPSGSEAMRNMYAKVGMYQEPTTSAEKLQAATVEGALGGLGGVGAARTIATNALRPGVQRVANWFAQQPTSQAFGGAGAAATPVAMRESGVEDPYALAAGSLAGGILSGKAGPALLEKGVRAAEGARNIATGANVSRDQALAQARADFQTATNSGIRYDPAAFNTFSQEAETALRANNWNPLSNRQAAVDDALALIQRYQGQPRTIDELHALRQDIGDLHAGASPQASRLLGVIQNRLDDFITTPTNATAAAGSVAEGQQALMGGIAGYSRWAKSEDILEAVDRASKNKNFSAALKSEFTKIANNPNKLKFFNPEERAAITNIAEGGANSSALQLIGALGPSNLSSRANIVRAILPTAVGGYGMYTQDPTAIAFGAGLAGAGAGAKGLQNFMSRGYANELAASMRRGDVRAPMSAFTRDVAGRTVPQTLMYAPPITE
jgi:hypothetical protein